MALVSNGRQLWASDVVTSRGREPITALRAYRAVTRIGSDLVRCLSHGAAIETALAAGFTDGEVQAHGHVLPPTALSVPGNGEGMPHQLVHSATEHDRSTRALAAKFVQYRLGSTPPPLTEAADENYPDTPLTLAAKEMRIDMAELFAENSAQPGGHGMAGGASDVIVNSRDWHAKIAECQAEREAEAAAAAAVAEVTQVSEDAANAVKMAIARQRVVSSSSWRIFDMQEVLLER